MLATLLPDPSSAPWAWPGRPSERLTRRRRPAPRLVFVGCRVVRGVDHDLSHLVRAWARGRPNERHLLAEVDRAAAESSRGCDPTAVHRLLFGLLAGATADDLHRTATRQARRQRAATVRVRHALLRRQALGDVVVLVSELPRPCVVGTAIALRAHVLGPDTAVDADGRLTGEVDAPLIGAERAAAAGGFAADRGASLAACTGVGCSWADLDLLHAVGSAHVVGDHPALLRMACERGWNTAPYESTATAASYTA